MQAKEAAIEMIAAVARKGEKKRRRETTEGGEEKVTIEKTMFALSVSMPRNRGHCFWGVAGTSD